MKDRTNMHPYCRVLYKTDDTPGWYVAYMDGNIQIVTSKCEKLWSVFRVMDGGARVERVKDVYPADVLASDAHLLCGWTYSSELDKWFLSDEILPKPKSKCRTVRNFDIECDFDADLDEIEDKKQELFEDSWYDFKEIDIAPDVTFSTNGCSHTFSFLYFKYGYKETFEELFKAIDENRFFCFFVDEYWYTQILVWTDDQTCRIIVQDYTSNEKRGVVEPVDFIINKKKAIETLKKWENDLNAKIDEIEIQVLSILSDDEKKRLRNDNTVRFCRLSD